MNSGVYLLGVSTVYFLAGMINTFVYKFDQNSLLTMMYCIILSLPLFIPPLARAINMQTIFEMLSRDKVQDMPDNVIKFPEPKIAEEEPSRECYRIGYDESTKLMTLTVLVNGVSSVTMRMNYAAAQQMMKMIECAFPDKDKE